jgi:uroporphyrinogen-III synthase
MSIRVVITRPQKDAHEFAQALSAIGCEVIIMPTIEISPILYNTPLHLAITNFDCYDWLILTSANAVNIFFDRLAALRIEQLPPNLRIATIGEKTAASLIQRGFHPDLIPDEYISDAIKSGLGDLKGKWVLLPTADIAADILPQAIEKDGGIVNVVPIYHTKPAVPDPKSLSALRSGVDIITFTSGSTARNFVQIVRQAGMYPQRLPGSPLYACIGPKTAQVVRELGLPVDIIAKIYTTDGLLAAIQDHLEANRSKSL